MKRTDIDQIFATYIAEIEAKAKVNYKRQKWIMFGYYKAIAVHLRRLHRMIRTDIFTKEAGFPTRHERSQLEDATLEIEQLRAEVGSKDKRIRELNNKVGSLTYDLGKAEHENEHLVKENQELRGKLERVELKEAA